MTQLETIPAVQARPKRSPLSVGKAVALLVVVGFLVYVNSLDKVFLLDDDEWIGGNKNITDLMSYLKCRASRTVVALTLYVNYYLGGLYVGGYHVVNLLIHLGAGLTLFGVIRRTLLLPRWGGRFQDSAPGLALAAALLWLVHPLLTQAVTYIVQRDESLMGLFFLLALYFVLRGAAPGGSRLWYPAAVVCSALGMACKEVMVALPLVVLAFDWVFLADSFGQIWRRRWALYLGLFCTWGMLAIRKLGTMTDNSAGFNMAHMKSLHYFLTQPAVICHYLGLAVWPARLCFDYKDWPLVQTARGALVPGFVLSLLFLATAWALWRRSWLGFLGAWFFLVLGPTSSFMPILDVAFEHRMYLPLAAVVVLAVGTGAGILGWISRRFHWPEGRKRAAAVGLVALATVLLGGRTMLRNEDYRSGAVMNGDVVAQRPNNARGHTNLGYYLMNENRNAEAVAHLRRALELDNKKEVPNVNLAYLLWKLDRTEEAFQRIRTALWYYPYSSLAHDVHGVMLLAEGKTDAAVAALRKAVDNEPRDAEFRFDLALALGRQGKKAEARAQYDEGLRLEPNRPWSLRGRAWRRLLEEPAPGPNLVKQALFWAEEACQAQEYKYPAPLDTLAAALAANGQFREAVLMAGRARDLAAKFGQEELREQIEQRLRLYQLGLPFRREYLSRAAGKPKSR